RRSKLKDDASVCLATTEGSRAVKITLLAKGQRTLRKSSVAAAEEVVDQRLSPLAAHCRSRQLEHGATVTPTRAAFAGRTVEVPTVVEDHTCTRGGTVASTFTL